MQFYYDNKFTFGNAITIATLVTGFTIGAATLQQVTAQNQARLSVVELALKESIRDQALSDRESELRLRSVEIAQASQSSDLRNIQVGINELKVSLVQISNQIRR